MARKQSRGLCSYCGKALSKGGMVKHLDSCAARKEAIAKAEKRKAKPELLFHLRVQDVYSSDYWLDLEMRGSKTLKDLDFYLREIWLECCGHLSDFFLGGAFSNEIAMSRPISSVFQTTREMTHVYDFGTSSETVIKAVRSREGIPTTTKPLVLMARNQMPDYPCNQCGQPATYFCMECIIEDDVPGFLCENHAEDHPHDDYGDPTELVNSPRLGMCGYTGPAEAPY